MSVEAVAPSGPVDHEVRFYDTVPDLAVLVGAFLAEGLLAGGVAVVAATPDHERSFDDALRRSRIDPLSARRNGRLLFIDAIEVRRRLVNEGALSADVFDEVVADPVRKVAGAGRPVRVYGEIVALLWSDGLVAAAIELEGLWNELQREIPFSLLCAYPSEVVSRPQFAGAVQQIRELHSHAPDHLGAPDVLDAGGPPLATEGRRFPRSAQTPRDARRFVVETLERWGLHDLIGDAALVASELTANAVIHARSEPIVTVSRQRGGIRISVQDGSRHHARSHGSSTDWATTHGLSLVAAVATGWGSDEQGSGKTVWAELEPQAPTSGVVPAG
jgi:hypothetical protein